MRANKSNYITYNAHFNDRLNALGFKRKNMNDFTAKMNDADLKICVTHSTYYIPHVRFYSMAFSVMYPKVLELLDLLNNRMVELTGNTTGYYPCLYSLAGHIMQPKRLSKELHYLKYLLVMPAFRGVSRRYFEERVWIFLSNQSS